MYSSVVCGLLFRRKKQLDELRQLNAQCAPVGNDPNRYQLLVTTRFGTLTVHMYVLRIHCSLHDCVYVVYVRV